MTRVRRNALAMGGTFVVQALFVFLQIKILTRFLPPAEFGLFSSVFAFGALLGSVAELGFSVVLPRYGAKFEAEGRPAAFRTLLGTAVGLWLGLGLSLGALLAVGAGPIARAIGRPEVTRGLLLLGYAAAMTFSLRAYASAAFQGLRRMTPALGVELVYMVGLTGTFLLVGHDLDAAAVFRAFLGWGIGAGLLGLGFFALATRGGAAGPTPRPAGLLREIAPFWGGAFLTTIVAISLESADRLLLAALVPLELVAAWHVAGRISLFTRKILFVPQQVAGPELAWKWQRGARDELAHDLRLFSKLEWALGVLLAMGVALGAHAGVLLASNDRYLAAVPALVSLAGAMPVLSLQAPLTTFLRAAGHIDVTVRAELILLVGSLAVGALLLPVLGLAGFGLGPLVAALAALLYTLAALERRGLPRPSRSFVFGHAAGGITLWGVAALVATLRPIASLSLLLAVGLLLALLFNIVVVRSRFLAPAESERLLGFLGEGAPARIGRWLLHWPTFSRG